MKGKNVANWAIVIAVAFALIAFLVAVILLRKIPSKEEVTAILMVAGFVLFCGSPVYVSLILENALGLKENRRKKDETH